MIKLLTPSPEYTDEHNAWLRQLPQTIRQLVFTVKRYYRPEWGDNWREHFTVDRINGFLGHELKYRQPEAGRQLSARRLRSRWLVAHLQTAARFQSRRQGAGGGRHHGVGRAAAREPERPRPGVRQSQREAGRELRDAAVPAAGRRHPSRRRTGRPKPTSPAPARFISNFEPLTVEQARAMVDHVVEFDQYTEPMKQLLDDFVANPGIGLRRLVRASAHGGRQAVQESALSAEAARPGESARCPTSPKWARA